MLISQPEICECCTLENTSCFAVDKRSPFLACDRLISDSTQILTVYEIYPRGERLDCYILRAGRRVKRTIHLSASGYISTFTRIQNS